MRDSGPGRGEPGDGRIVEVHRVRQPDVVTEPGERIEILHWRTAEPLGTVLLLVRGLGQMRVQPDSGAPRQFRCLGRSSLVTENGEHGATPIRSIESGESSWNCSMAALLAARISSRLFHRIVGRQPAGARAEIHRAPRRVEPEADVRAAARRPEHITAVRGTRSDGPSWSCSRSGLASRVRRWLRPDQSGSIAGPDRIQLGQPLEQRGVGCHPPGRPLIQVMVGVDQAGSGQAAGGIDPADSAAPSGPPRLRAAARPDRGDPIVVEDDCPLSCSPRRPSIVTIAQPSRISVLIGVPASAGRSKPTAAMIAS